MEFRYRAVDERRSRSPPPPAAPSTYGSGSAEGHGSDGPAERTGNSAVTLRKPDLPLPDTAAAAVDADELRRQAEKARIRERILREEAEHRELELEVRSELREQMLQLSWPALGRTARGSATPAAAVSLGTITAANSSLLPVVALEAHLEASALATAPTKRKSPDHAAGASTISLAPSSSKKQKSTLTCTACGISATSEKAMQDHLNGKVHRKKAVALPELELPNLVPDETEQETGLEADEEAAMAMETLGDYKPSKFMMLTTAVTPYEVTQMDGYLLCELCNVRTTDRITMMCHLQGGKHISNDQKNRQPSIKPSGAATASFDPNKKQKLVLEDYSVPLPHTVRRMEGFLHCELCDVKVASMNGMRQHLSGKKHKNKANTSSNASINLSSGGKKEAAKAQQIDADHTAVISDMATMVEAPLAKKSLQPKLGDDSELQEMIVAPPKEDVPTGANNNTPGTEMMKSRETSVGAQLNNSDSLTMEVDNVMHPLQRVDGLLVCLSCNAKAPSEMIMRSHLAGKKHKRKMTLAAARGNTDLSVLATAVDENSSKSTPTKGNMVVPQAKTIANEEAQSAPSLAVSQTNNTAVMASMEVHGPAEAQLATCIREPAEDGEITEEAEAEQAAVHSNGSMTQSKESVIADDATAPVKPIKIQVEGKVFTVMQQENGRLSCELCGVHGCDKDSMILHLYTSTHWAKASLAEKKEEQVCMAAVAMVDKDGEVGSMALAGEAEV